MLQIPWEIFHSEQRDKAIFCINFQFKQLERFQPNLKLPNEMTHTWTIRQKYSKCCKYGFFGGLSLLSTIFISICCLLMETRLWIVSDLFTWSALIKRIVSTQSLGGGGCSGIIGLLLTYNRCRIYICVFISDKLFFSYRINCVFISGKLFFFISDKLCFHIG